MRPANRKLTQRGLGGENADDLDDASPAPVSVKCPAPATSVAARPSSTYSYVAPRRPTLSAFSARRLTARMPVTLDAATDS